MMKPRHLCLAALMIARAAAPASAVTVAIDGNDQGRTFYGIGIVSAGASSDLLIDYAEPYRSDLLDYLFKPKFGAGIQHVKIEIGCGENSTCGSEACHAVTESEKDAPVNRGYEIWLMNEARKRSPSVGTEALCWGYPKWCGGYYTVQSAQWYVSFLNSVKNTCGFTVDYLSAARNESNYDRDWIVNTLRPAMVDAGFSDVKITGPDMDGYCWEIFENFDTDPEFRDLMFAVSYHYDWTHRERATTDEAKSSGKPLWSGEMHCYQGDGWDNALYFARGVNANYVVDGITNTQVWYGIDAMYPGLLFLGYGAVQCSQPWSGHYTVKPMAWAYAHTTQFTEIGWHYLDNACGMLSPGNSSSCFVTLRDPSSSNWSMIVCTDGASSMDASITGGLSTGTVHVWKSNQSDQFTQQADITPQNGSFTISLDANSIYTLSTTTGQQKGSRVIPANAAFPFPYEETYESYPVHGLPRYHSDQKGSFEVVDRRDSGKCLKQIVPTEGLGWGGGERPHTMFGDENWTDYEISADVYIDALSAEIGGRWENLYDTGYRFCVGKAGTWWLFDKGTQLRTGTIAGFDGTVWHNLKLRFGGSAIEAFLDNASVVRVTDDARDRGRAFLASAYAYNLFDNIRVVSLNGRYASATNQDYYHMAAEAVDGSDQSFWSTDWTVYGQLPQSITVSLGGPHSFTGIEYLPRQDGSADGRITSYRIYASLDNENFDEVARGTWADDATLKRATFAATVATWVRLEAVETHGPNVSAAEITLEGTPVPTIPSAGFGDTRPGIEIRRSQNAGGFVFSIHGNVGSRVTAGLYDMTGRLVRMLVDDVMGAETHEVVWDGSDGRGRRLARGTYLVRIAHANTVSFHRITSCSLTTAG